jgi:predicted RNA-binding protein (virulence factor B family)
VGDKLKGFIKKIYEDNRIDVAIGSRGYGRVEGEADKILRLLKEENGFLPYHDKSNPDDIYEAFGMSKKAFKMALGTLYKNKKISLADDGIRLMGN